MSLISGLFGERPADRRERLRQLLADLGQLNCYWWMFYMCFCAVEAGVKVDKKLEQAVAAPVEEKVCMWNSQ